LGVVHRHLTRALLVVALLLRASGATADDVVVMTSGAFTAAYQDLAPRFERSTRHTLITATTTMGTGAEAIPARLARGEPADVVIVAADSLEQLIASGLVLRGSRVDLARSPIAMAVRAGAGKPDIASVEALKRTLLDARSVAYSASVSGEYLVRELFPALGIAAEMTPKSRRIERERVGEVVARGEAAIGFQQLSELLPIRGIDIVGVLPPGAQRVTVFSAGIAANASHPGAARALIDYLASRDAAVTIAKSGMEPVGVR
jgi:molybdate transport system substrate-binding protein